MDNTELIARLREKATTGDLSTENTIVSVQPLVLMAQAADALEAAQAEIEEWKQTFDDMMKERDAALARLAELEKQKPVGYLYDWVHSSATGRADETYTGFTKDKAHAYKNDNAMAIYAAAGQKMDALARAQDEVARMAVEIERLTARLAELESQKPYAFCSMNEYGQMLSATNFEDMWRKHPLYLAAGAPPQPVPKPSQAGEVSNPNNCQYCDHSKNPQGGHCYIFREAPTEVCHKHTRAGVSAAINAKGGD